MKINQLTTKDIKSISAANRGMNAEDAINDTNEYYRLIDKAVIYKKPTPVQIVHVNYPSRNKAVITEAYYRTPSTTDYNGVYKGYYVDFEVKETANKNTYPLSNIKEHQYKHLLQIEKHKGIPFIIIKWAYYDEYYLMTLDFLKENMSINKSISYDTIKEKCYKIDNSFYNRIDYLKIVDILIKKCS